VEVVAAGVVARGDAGIAFSTLKRVVKGHSSCCPGGKVYTPNLKISSENELLPGLLQDRQKAGVQGAAAPWRSARCPRTLLISLQPQAAIRYFATALELLRNALEEREEGRKH